METKDRYIRVATTLYKIVRRPLLSGDYIEECRPWNYETFRQDHGKDELASIQKYDGFCSIPDHRDEMPCDSLHYEYGKKDRYNQRKSIPVWQWQI